MTWKNVCVCNKGEMNIFYNRNMLFWYIWGKWDFLTLEWHEKSFEYVIRRKWVFLITISSKTAIYWRNDYFLTFFFGKHDKIKLKIKEMCLFGQLSYYTSETIYTDLPWFSTFWNYRKHDLLEEKMIVSRTFFQSVFYALL